MKIPCRIIILFLSMLFLFAACGINSASDDNDIIDIKFQIVETITESRFFDEDGMEISAEKFKELFEGDTPNINLYGGLLNPSRGINDSQRAGEIVFEGFGRNTVFAGCWTNWSAIYAELEVVFNGQPVDIRTWWHPETHATQEFGWHDFAFNLSLNDEVNELILSVKLCNGSYVKTTVFIEPIGN